MNIFSIRTANLTMLTIPLGFSDFKTDIATQQESQHKSQQSSSHEVSEQSSTFMYMSSYSTNHTLVPTKQIHTLLDK